MFCSNTEEPEAAYSSKKIQVFLNKISISTLKNKNKAPYLIKLSIARKILQCINNQVLLKHQFKEFFSLHKQLIIFRQMNNNLIQCLDNKLIYQKQPLIIELIKLSSLSIQQLKFYSRIIHINQYNFAQQKSYPIINNSKFSPNSILESQMIQIGAKKGDQWRNKAAKNQLKKATVAKNGLQAIANSQDPIKQEVSHKESKDGKDGNKFESMAESASTVNEDLVYPTINIYSCPRVYQQKVQNDRIPLCLYRQRIYSSNCKKSYESLYPEASTLSKFAPRDGMIFNMRDIKSKNRNIEDYIGPIKILVCVCMYNESRNAINLTLNGIYDNLPNFEENGFSVGDIAVVLIQDGILKLVSDRVSRTLAKGTQSMVQLYAQMDKIEGKPKCELRQRINVILDQIDNYNRKGMKDFVSKNTDFPPSIQKNISLLYQNLWYPQKTKVVRGQSETSSSNNEQDQDKDQSRRLRVFSCFKHTNGTKLSSHLWFFQGFCRYIQPKYCVLLDVGTKPDEFGVVNLIKGFNHKDIGGVTGFMSVDSNFKSEQGGAGGQEQEDGFFKKNFFSIQKAQEYQYIIAHFLDKNAESALGFLHVLPGAWSAYRYKALIKSDFYEPNLLERSYFKMILNPQLEDKDYMEANMYLAEDRILSLGIYCQMDCKYLLKYVPNAVAYTDPMKSHKDLMTQRRRWINSSLFAFLYVFRNYYFNVMDSRHNFFRKYITLNISMWVAMISTINSYLTPSFYFFILYATVLQIGGYGTFWQHLAKTVSFFYVITYFVAVGGGLVGKPWMQKAQYISYILTVYTVLLLILVTYNVLFVYLKLAKGLVEFNSFNVIALVVMLFINIGSFLLLLGMHIPTHWKFLVRIMIDSASYLAFTGAYSQTMVAYSFCNVDDVSWGTKGSSDSHGGGKKYATDKVFFVAQWLFWNGLLSFLFLYVDIIIPGRTGSDGGVVLIAIAIYGSCVIVTKTGLATWYHFKWIIFERLLNNFEPDWQRKQKVDEYWDTHEEAWAQYQQKLKSR